jgi:hypothetical protein
MADYLRLRQICLVARELGPVIADIRAILGLEICYRDSGVAKYGLANALLPIGTSFLEVVAPVEPNTAPGASSIAPAATAATWRSSTAATPSGGAAMRRRSASASPT